MKIRYDNHTTHYHNLSLDASNIERAVGGSDATMNVWRQKRTLGPLIPLFKEAAAKTWVTVGDGAFGGDALLLMRFGIADVHASDLTDHLLKQASEHGLIKNYSAQNAEAMSFSDNEFDFVFCKDAYHHFPRPILAIYESLRVCRHAVILVEPPDPLIGLSLRTGIQRFFGKSHHEFEDVGNYVYWVSEREFEKLMLGAALRHCAFKTVNDLYIPGMEHVPVTGGAFSDKLFRLKVKLKGILRDALSAFHVIRPNCLIAILFKSPPTDMELAALQKGGFRVKELPRNPYIS